MKIIYSFLMLLLHFHNFFAQDKETSKKHIFAIDIGTNLPVNIKKPSFSVLTFADNTKTDWQNSQKLIYDSKFNKGAIGYNFGIYDNIRLNAKFKIILGLSFEALTYKLKHKNTIYSETYQPLYSSTISSVYENMYLKKIYNFFSINVGLSYKINEKINANFIISDEILYSHEVERDVESNNTKVSVNFKYKFVKIPLQYLGIKTSFDFAFHCGTKIKFNISPYLKCFPLNSYRFTNQENFNLLYINGFENRNFLISTGVNLKYVF